MPVNIFRRPVGPSSDFEGHRWLRIDVVNPLDLEFVERALGMQPRPSGILQRPERERAVAQLQSVRRNATAIGAIGMSMWCSSNDASVKPGQHHPLRIEDGFMGDAGYGYATSDESGQVTVHNITVVPWARGSSVSGAVLRSLLQQFDPASVIKSLDRAPGTLAKSPALSRDAVSLTLGHAFEGGDGFVTTGPPQEYDRPGLLTVGEALAALPLQFPDLSEMAIMTVNQGNQ